MNRIILVVGAFCFRGFIKTFMQEIFNTAPRHLEQRAVA